VIRISVVIVEAPRDTKNTWRFTPSVVSPDQPGDDPHLPASGLPWEICRSVAAECRVDGTFEPISAA
jgi:hypothetical protein